MSEFKNKTVLVTGGTLGIGNGIANCFLREGANVHITGTRAKAVDYEVDLSAFTYHQADLSTSEGCKGLYEVLPNIDILVNNAGGGRGNEFEMEDFRYAFDLNLFAIMELCLLYYECLEERGGAIVNIGSLASHLNIRDKPAYTASKSAVYGLTRALADKWAPRGIRVNMVAPGFVPTRMNSHVTENERISDPLLRSIPMKRYGNAEEIGQAVIFLASDKASYITGISLHVDGGLILR